MRAAGYVRVSTQEQVEHGYNLEADKHLVRELCERRGWQLVEVYDDGGRQGDDPDRPGLLRMLGELERFDVLVIRSQDRITRDPGIWATVTAALALADVQVETFTGPLDYRSPTGELSGNIMAAIGKFEKRQIGARTKQALAARARQGFHTGGPPPFGYRWQDGQLVKVPAEARVVERMFSDYLDGKGQRTIARELGWHQSKVSRILGSELYAGKLAHDGQLFDGQHEAIISDDTWHRAERLRKSGVRRKGGRHADGGHLLTRGLLRCGRCGSAMIPRKARPGVERDRYVCSGRIAHGSGSCSMPSVRRQEIDAPVLKTLLDSHVDLEATVQRIEAQRQSDLQAVRDLVDEADRAIMATDARLTRVRRDYQDAKLEAEDYREQRSELLQEREAASEGLRRAESHLEAMERSEATSDAAANLYRYLGDLKQAVADGVTRAPDLRALRHTIAMIFKEVRLRKAEDWPDAAEEFGDEGDGLYLEFVMRDPAWMPWDAPKRPLVMPVPTGQDTPVPEWQSYPNGFLCRYCWW